MKIGWLSGQATLLAVLVVGSSTAGPYDIVLHPGPRAPTARGEARLVFADSPFGVAVTEDGRHSYNVRIDARGMPEPATLGAFHAFVAWEVSPDLSEWRRLGAVTNGSSTVGRAEMNKFLLVITAELDSMPAQRVGPTVLHGTSPSGWLQSFLTHPLFRGISQ